MAQGKFITFEGIDGAGKTTQIEALHRFLLDNGIEVVRTREPGGTPLGEKIRAMLLNDDMDVTAETLLFFAARAQHIRDVILPAVKLGTAAGRLHRRKRRIPHAHPHKGRCPAR